MANVTLTEGVQALPQDSNTGRLWGKVRRQQYTNQGFPASTTTPFSGNTPVGILVWDAKLAYAANPTATPAGELDMSAELSGIVLVIANNGSGETLSGITLKDYDVLPTSGLAVPSQSYTTATNVATGASVTLSSLSLANNTAIRLLIPITNGSLRQFYVNPTYGSAVTEGTGSLEVMAIPVVDLVALKGSYGTPGATAPSTFTPAGGTDGTNGRMLLTDSNGRLYVIGSAAPGDGISSSYTGLLAVAEMEGIGSGGSWYALRIGNGVIHQATITTATTTALWTPASGKRFRVLGGIISSDTAMRVYLQDAAGQIIASFRLAANQTVPFGQNAGMAMNGYLSAAANNALNVVTGAAGNVDVTASGTEE